MDLGSVLVAFLMLVALLLLCLMLVAYAFRDHQSLLLYHPGMPEESLVICSTPPENGISVYDSITITTKDGVALRGYLVRPENSSVSDQTVIDRVESSLIIYFHGNAGNVGHRLSIARVLARDAHAAVLMMDYRGYGMSDKHLPPSEEGLKVDGEAVLDYALNHIPHRKGRVYVMGTSLGGAVSVHLASQKKFQSRIAGLILENTFTSISDMVDALATPIITQQLRPRLAMFAIPILKYVIKPLTLFIGWRSCDHIPKISVPILFLSGREDELVPAAHMDRLYSLATRCSEKRLQKFPDGQHNNLCTKPLYFTTVKEWISANNQKREAHYAVSM